jgi:stage II sporulation protein R
MGRILLAAALAAALVSTFPPPSAAPSVRLQAPAAHLPDVLRFRVIANSDSLWDEAVKTAVRNLVLQTLTPTLSRAHSVGQAERLLGPELARLQAVVDALLQRDDVSYRARVTLGRTAFPTKAYGAWVLPAGRYPALIVTLGRGRGHNWWCVLFPELCFVDIDTALAVPVATVRDRAPVTPHIQPGIPLRLSWPPWSVWPSSAPVQVVWKVSLPRWLVGLSRLVPP